MGKKLLMGIGNEYCGNDSIGIIIARHLKENLTDYELKTGSFTGIDFLEAIVGYDDVVVIDSLYKSEVELGVVYKIRLKEHRGLRGFSYLHSFGIYEAIQLARELKLKLPEKLKIFGIGIDKRGEIGASLDPLLASKIEEIVKEILHRLQKSSLNQ